jgi:hypothetical protein
VNALLVVAVVAPLGSLVPAITLLDSSVRWRQVSAAVAAIAWTILLVAARHPQVGALAPDELALAAAAGVALLAVVLRGDEHAPLIGAGAASLTAGLAAGTRAELFLGVAVGAVLLAAVRTRVAFLGPIATGGLLFAAIGLRIGGPRGAGVVVVAATVVGVVAASASARSALVLLLPVALALGLRAAPTAVPAPWLAVGLGATGAILALPWVRFAAPAAAFVPWAMVAAVAPVGATGAARAIAAGAVLALAAGGPVARLAAVPGAVVLAHALATTTHGSRGALAVAAAVTIAGLSRGPSRTDPVRARAVDLLPLALVAALVLRPTSWAWLRISGLDAYTDGMAVGVAAGLAVLVVAGATGSVITADAAATWALGPDPRHAARRANVFVVAATAAMGLVAVALVR